MNTRGRKALVFSGGGARGAYQIGCWKAMDELGISKDVSAIFGTSVGAINAAAFVQGDLELSEELWKQLSYDKVFSNLRPKTNKRFSKRFFNLARLAIKEKGLNVGPLKKLMRDFLDEEKIRSSPLDYGLVVFDWVNKKPIYLTKKEILEGELIEYIIASSTFPVFQPHRINDKIFIDGGVYDNRPLAFCEGRKDIDNIICVDVTIARHFWPNKKKKMRKMIDFIRPSRLLGSPLAFNIERISRNIELGHHEALLHFEKSAVLV